MSTATFDGDHKPVDVKAMLTKSLSQSWTNNQRRLVNGVNGLFAHDKWNFLWVSVVVVLSVFLYLMVYHGSIASALVGFIYPAYATVSSALWPPATETAGDRNRVAAKTKWLVYWPTFAMVLMLDSPVSSFLRAIKPFYYLLQIGFFVWCFAPIKNNGTEFVYAFGAWLLERYNRFLTDKPSEVLEKRFNHVECPALKN